MRMEFSIYSVSQLGQRLNLILSSFDESGPFSVKSLSTADSIQLSHSEAIADAAGAMASTLEIETFRGAIRVRWMYGPRATWQRISGVLNINKMELQAFANFLSRLSAAAESTYTFADLESRILRDTERNRGAFLTDESLFDVYWFNYFGHSISKWMGPDVAETNSEYLVDRLANGSIVVTLKGDSFLESDENQNDIALRWHFFRARTNGSFPEKLEVDFSVLKSAHAPLRASGKLSEFVGDPHAFIRDVGSLARQFDQWAKEIGTTPKTTEEFADFLKGIDARLTKERVIQAIASYGETVRAASTGHWKSMRMLYSGEPVIIHPSFPWVVRPVLEILELIS